MFVVATIFVLNSSYYKVQGKPQVPCYFIFGDSLVDNGNNNRLWNKRLAASLQHLAASLQQIRGCLGTTWKKQLDLLKMDIISKTTAPYETRHNMEHCIKALCSPDVTMRFKIEESALYPNAYSVQPKQFETLGKTRSDRHNFAFYARNMHRYLRKILLEYWDNKDADMKIMDPMPPGVANKMNYIQHMKSIKYCIWPKGYEVLKWDAFSVIVAEKDIPNLKSILTAITDEKYKELRCDAEREVSDQDVKLTALRSNKNKNMVAAELIHLKMSKKLSKELSVGHKNCYTSKEEASRRRFYGGPNLKELTHLSVNANGCPVPKDAAERAR
ncbi:probable glycosyltransferase [Tanacetum coccineum]